MRRVGLSGGIASGKSTVAQMLSYRGTELIDADQISRALTAPGGMAISPIVALFGPDVLCTDGGLDRERMRFVIFNSIHHKLQLESILHPLIRDEIDSLATDIKKRSDNSIIIFDIPLLTESSYWKSYFEAVWVVDCCQKTQLDRLIKRSQMSVATAKQIIESQTSRRQRCAVADAVIFNDNISLRSLQSQTDQLAVHFGL